MNLYTSSTESLSLLRAMPRRNTRGLCSQGTIHYTLPERKSSWLKSLLYVYVRLVKSQRLNHENGALLPRWRIFWKGCTCCISERYIRSIISECYIERLYRGWGLIFFSTFRLGANWKGGGLIGGIKSLGAK
jgi:hypothetical protein